MARGFPGRGRGPDSGPLRLRGNRRRFGRRQGRVAGLGGQHPDARGPAVQEGPPRPEDAHRHHSARRGLRTHQDLARQPHQERLARCRLPGQPGRGGDPREREVRLRGLARRPRPEAGPRRLHPRLPRHLHLRRQDVLPAQRHRPHRPVVRRDADEAIRLPGPQDLGRVPADRSEGGPGTPRHHRRSRQRQVRRRHLLRQQRLCNPRHPQPHRGPHRPGPGELYPGRRSAPATRPEEGGHHRRAHRPGLRQVRQGRQDPDAACPGLVRRLHVRTRLQGARGTDRRGPHAHLARREQAVRRSGRWRSLPRLRARRRTYQGGRGSRALDDHRHRPPGEAAHLPRLHGGRDEMGRGQVEGPVLRLRPDARPHRGSERTASRLRRGPLRSRLAEQLQRHARQGDRLGGNLRSALASWQDKLEAAARTSGYTVG